ncbi:MAG: hypothetical protein AAGI69_13965 [Cyanobacteria bacterium P01_H01_bin.21]
MQSSGFVPVDFLLQKLAQSCREAYTGCLYFVSSENRVGKFALEQGEIVLVRYYLDTDREAIRLIQQLDQVKYRLSDQAISGAEKSKSLPSNAAILKMLGLEEQSTVAQSEQSQIALPANNQNGATTQKISNETKAKLQEQLILCLGPIASIICQQVFEESDDLMTVVERLVNHISDPEEARAFLQAVKTF